jgi:hypothetical protein
MNRFTAITIPAFIEGSGDMVDTRRSEGRWKISTPPVFKAFGAAKNMSEASENSDLASVTGRGFGCPKHRANGQKLSALTASEWKSQGSFFVEAEEAAASTGSVLSRNSSSRAFNLQTRKV